MYGHTPISPHSPPVLTPAQTYLTRVYSDCTFKYRLANVGGDMFSASIHFDAMGELERLFRETLKGDLNGLPHIAFN